MKPLKPLLFLILAFATLRGISQNSPPVISNITSLADTIANKLNITFNLYDVENDTLQVSFRVSIDSGISYQYNTDNAMGAIGWAVMPGNAKQIEWYYPDSLSKILSRLSIRLIVDDRQGIDIQQIVNQIDTVRLKQNLQFVEGIRHRITDSIHLQQVRDTLLNLFQSYGFPTRVHSFPFTGGYTGKNIIGRKPGTDTTTTYIVDGHYDTVNDSPGADDNGSSIAAIMEILRVIAPLNLEKTVEFIGFDLEEAGLSGSEAYVVNGIPLNQDIAGVINMDMIAYYSEQANSQTVPALFDVAFPHLYQRLVADSFRGNFIISTANTFSLPMLTLFETMATHYVPQLLVGSIQVPGNGEIIPDARRSDHAAFWDSGYVALHLSDGAETRNPHYHSPADVSSTVNYNFMSNVTKAVTATLLNLAAPSHTVIAVSSVNVDPASGILQMNESNCNLLLSPNPSNGQFRITTNGCKEASMNLRVYSIEGKLIWQSVLQANTETEIATTLQQGFYILEWSNSKGTQSRKLVIR